MRLHDIATPKAALMIFSSLARTPRGPVLVLAVLTLAGCGSPASQPATGRSAPPAAAPAGPAASAAAGAGADSCTILTAADLTAATGKSFDAGTPSTAGGVAICRYTGDQGDLLLVERYPTSTAGTV